MECNLVQQTPNTECELNKSNVNNDESSVVSCLDDDLNYTYAESCNGGIYLLLLLKIVFGLKNLKFKLKL